jgi:hypothetical protein
VNESDKKLITEKLLGECWHNKFINDGREGLRSLKRCRYCDSGEKNRSFTDPQDFMDCFEKLVEKGELFPFRMFAWFQWYDTCPDSNTALDNEHHNTNFERWLLSRTESGHYRLCVLCAEWLKAQGTVVEWRQATDKTTWS